MNVIPPLSALSGLQTLRVLDITSTRYNNTYMVPCSEFRLLVSMGLLWMSVSSPFSVALLFALDAHL